LRALSSGASRSRRHSIRRCRTAARSAAPGRKRCDAREIVDHQIDVIKTHWVEVCDQAALTEVDRRGL
jgi:hypothetical protein